MSDQFQNDVSEESEVSLVDAVRAELEEIDASDLTEHAARFEALHNKLSQTLNSIDGL